MDRFWWASWFRASRRKSLTVNKDASSGKRLAELDSGDEGMNMFDPHFILFVFLLWGLIWKSAVLQKNRTKDKNESRQSSLAGALRKRIPMDAASSDHPDIGWHPHSSRRMIL